jgi:hypothetical protein
MFTKEQLMRYRPLEILLMIAGMAASPATAAEQRNFIVLPVTTPLQRQALGSKGAATATAYVLVNGTLVGDDRIRWSGLDFDSLRVELVPLAKKNSTVIFRIYHASADNEPGRDLLRWALLGFARETTPFQNARAETVMDGRFDWQKQLDVVAELDESETADEPLDEDNAVAVSPVRTALSRLLYNADCVVTLKSTFAADADGRLEPDVEESILVKVGALELPRKNMLLFRVRFKQGGQPGVDRFYQVFAKRLSKALGFADCATQTQMER